MSSNVKPLRYWVQKVLPLVYDNSLSYYELLDKVVYKINELVNSNNTISENTEDITIRVNELEVTLEDLMNGEYNKIIEEYISEAIKMVFFAITDSGYFVAYIPDSWDEITFNTTGYDIEIASESEFGHLVLSY